ncbi:PSP1 C-terminal conserved region family protein [Trichomonas vaginalis G3]|uniref:PSP1 C-terminal conserved region family protein n=1 Tax=Trichomonas vaginalis (strain ATCC PRA-98 / G3) TaxID=412133 RepID=A2DIE8_TRIV3|nr:PSP1 C-terminal conserved region-containing protein [Trichomonas vaginalis G3]EAY19752.1 PSP1 C-terminal conserved region family protein [Trichomonas vaginalis G3]KAI5523949.1 PSP1 C-terminal conserved region-containing protein [Trichomonas vaginalis G3]|eukprot:XP_001580738.1 PSP1 C-terminal conserved region family protein [Trichomonas vaginalis G3]
MGDSWAMFTEDIDYDHAQTSSPPVAATRDVWDDETPSRNYYENPDNNSPPLANIEPLIPESPEFKPPQEFVVPESAPSGRFNMPFGSLPLHSYQEKTLYASVVFNSLRNEIFKFKSSLEVKPGCFVITEADRGLDIGSIASIIPSPKPKDMKNAKAILRIATPSEIQEVQMKLDKERRAKEICQQKANELGLKMTIITTEFQFDGKKLTVYFSADQFVDFRNLVRSLFKFFETRIWMVWYDGNAPVKDVLEQRNAQMYRRD